MPPDTSNGVRPRQKRKQPTNNSVPQGAYLPKRARKYPPELVNLCQEAWQIYEKHRKNKPCDISTVFEAFLLSDSKKYDLYNLYSAEYDLDNSDKVQVIVKEHNRRSSSQSETANRAGSASRTGHMPSSSKEVQYTPELGIMCRNLCDGYSRHKREKNPNISFIDFLKDIYKPYNNRGLTYKEFTRLGLTKELVRNLATQHKYGGEKRPRNKAILSEEDKNRVCANLVAYYKRCVNDKEISFDEFKSTYHNGYFKSYSETEIRERALAHERSDERKEQRKPKKRKPV